MLIYYFIRFVFLVHIFIHCLVLFFSAYFHISYLGFSFLCYASIYSKVKWIPSLYAGLNNIWCASFQDETLVLSLFIFLQFFKSWCIIRVVILGKGLWEALNPHWERPLIDTFWKSQGRDLAPLSVRPSHHWWKSPIQRPMMWMIEVNISVKIKVTETYLWASELKFGGRCVIEIWALRAGGVHINVTIIILMRRINWACDI